MPADQSRRRWVLLAVAIVVAVGAAVLIPYLAPAPSARPIESPAGPVVTPPPAAHPPVAAAAAPAEPASLAWTLPEGWSTIPTQPMRLASFSAGEGATCGLFLFQGGGDRLANVNRWRGQVGLPALDEAGLQQALVSGTGSFGTFHWLPVRGPSKAFLAAIVPTPAGQAFVKLEAPGERLEALQAGFLAFTSSLRAP